MAQLVASVSGVVRGKIFTASIGSVDSLYIRGVDLLIYHIFLINEIIWSQRWE